MANKRDSVVAVFNAQRSRKTPGDDDETNSTKLHITSRQAADQWGRHCRCCPPSSDRRPLACPPSGSGGRPFPLFPDADTDDAGAKLSSVRGRASTPPRPVAQSLPLPILPYKQSPVLTELSRPPAAARDNPPPVQGERKVERQCNVVVVLRHDPWHRCEQFLVPP